MSAAGSSHPQGLPGLTISIAEGPVLFAVRGRLRDGTRDGMAEHLLLRRLQHRTGTQSQSTLSTINAHTNARATSCIPIPRALILRWDWQEKQTMPTRFKDLSVCV